MGPTTCEAYALSPMASIHGHSREPMVFDQDYAHSQDHPGPLSLGDHKPTSCGSKNVCFSASEAAQTTRVGDSLKPPFRSCSALAICDVYKEPFGSLRTCCFGRDASATHIFPTMYPAMIVRHGFFMSCFVWTLRACDVIASLLTSLIYRKQEPPAVAEPPILTSQVPFIGHLLRMFSDGSEYLRHLAYASISLPTVSTQQLTDRTAGRRPISQSSPCLS